MPDALSRLPLHTDTEPTDIDDSFPDDPSSSAPNHYVGPHGPTLHNVALADTPSDKRGYKKDTPIATLFVPSRQTPLINIPARRHRQHLVKPNMFPFDPGGQTALRQSQRRRTPSFRLRAPVSSQGKSTPLQRTSLIPPRRTPLLQGQVQKT